MARKVPAPQNQNPQTATPLNDNYFRPYPGYGNIPMQIWDGNSSYHSLQLQARRLSRTAFQYGVVFTFSKAMDYSEGDSTTSGGVAQYLSRTIWNYGLAGYDRSNVLTFFFLWDVPRLSRVLRTGSSRPSSMAGNSPTSLLSKVARLPPSV